MLASNQYFLAGESLFFVLFILVIFFGHNETFFFCELFRREPEFWLDKQDRFPVPILSAEQQEELTRKAEIPTDNTPKYNPENILSPEYAGVSNYESGVGEFLEETRQKLAKLRNDPLASEKEIREAENNLVYLESLHENYFLGMNVFRTAKGGRNKIK